LTSVEIQNMMNNAKEDYPELQYDSSRVSGDASGKALREVRKKAEAKIQDRRSTYDDHMTRAHRYALALGGWRGYEGYEGFGLESLSDGSLDHQIGKRTIFEVDAIDELEEELQRATVAETWDRAGVPIEFTAGRLGFTDQQIEDLKKIKAQKADEQAKADQAAAVAKAGAMQAGASQTSPKAAAGKPVQHDPQRPQANP
jgi:hypothetical protein